MTRTLVRKCRKPTIRRISHLVGKRKLRIIIWLNRDAMTGRLKSPLVWAAVSMLAGALVSHLSGLAFWASSLIVGLALIAIGLVADWEDRGKFND